MHKILPFVMVFLGGGLGSICRYSISKFFSSNEGFPYATFIANVISCIILGYLVAWSMKKGLSSNVALLWMTGFCGGFSTFSTFSAESYKLFESNQIGMALLYIGMSIIICLFCVYLGIKIHQSL